MSTRKPDPAAEAWAAGLRTVTSHALFSGAGWVERTASAKLASSRGYAFVTSTGEITCHSQAALDPDEWAWVIAHAMLHRYLGHVAEGRGRLDETANAVACLEVNRFLRESKVGRPPLALPAELPRGDVAVLEQRWRQEGIPAEFRHAGTAGFAPDIVVTPVPADRRVDWPALFARNVAEAATRALAAAGGIEPGGLGRHKPPWEAARSWFVSSYPLLGGLASQFTIVADAELARSWHISIAAVNAEAGELYINPVIQLSQREWRFVLAHEMLHAALRHGDRAGGRDPYLWNVAADYVVNGWLVEMQVGDLPDGVLHDATLAGLSAETVHDLITTDLRRRRKLLRLATMRGRGLGDVLGEPIPRPGGRGPMDLDEYYRRALATGLSYHDSAGRGVLPAGLVEEIRALEQPPLAWDAQLARWFEEFVRSPAPIRSYARPSRRQSSTPDIPRAGRYRPEEAVPRCTFGVVIDTSGSMDNRLLGKALGAVASYATAREVPRARVVFCDAAAYDAGYLSVEEIAGRVRVRGRGGTVLQPGVRVLEQADDFPADAPILIITDAGCDHVRVRREHAFLIPNGASLPFVPKGPVFRMV